jgi:sugar lactone lactonase YvrE
VVIDSKDRLWVLDTGSVNFQPPLAGGPKLVCYDLDSNQEIKRITFPNTALSTTYLNDVRFNLNMGREGFAFVTDSSDRGPNAIIVVDLESGNSWRRLEGDPSVTAEDKFVPTVEGEAMMSRPVFGSSTFLRNGSDGVAVSADGNALYYCPLASHKISVVSIKALADQEVTDDTTAGTVRPLEARNYASDGLECDAQGYLYLTDYEHNAIHRRNADGTNDQIIAQDPRMIWPDSVCAAADGYLYFTCNQLNRLPRFHEGKDLRQQPYVLFRTRINQPAMTMMMSDASTRVK